MKQTIQRKLKGLFPLPLDVFLTQVFYDPDYGYYNQKVPMGRGGDYITAPEISQLFGEMIALWAMDLWQQAGCPEPIRVVEYGPGKGTMMADFLRASRVLPKFLGASTVHLIDASTTLRAAQEESLKYHKNVYWHDSLDSVPEGFTFILANEFFDALPIKQLVLRDNKWFEVGVDENLSKVYLPCQTPNLRFKPKEEIPIELGTFDLAFVVDMARRLLQNDGAILIIDYGDDLKAWQGDTLQALYKHKIVDVFEYFGKADITRHVDFRTLRDYFSHANLEVYGTQTQGEFLKQMGIESRANQLAKNMDLSQKMDLQGALSRLIGPQYMGELFKVIAATHLDGKPLGFDGCKF